MKNIGLRLTAVFYYVLGYFVAWGIFHYGVPWFQNIGPWFIWVEWLAFVFLVVYAFIVPASKAFPSYRYVVTGLITPVAALVVLVFFLPSLRFWNWRWGFLKSASGNDYISWYFIGVALGIFPSVLFNTYIVPLFHPPWVSLAIPVLLYFVGAAWNQNHRKSIPYRKIKWVKLFLGVEVIFSVLLLFYLFLGLK